MFRSACRFQVAARSAALVGAAFVIGHGTIHAYTPDSPEVQAMVKKAIPVLESAQHPHIGGHALMALALLKAEKPTSPKIAQTATACVRWVNEVKSKGLDETHYDAAMVCIFLAELDKLKYRSEVETLMAIMFRNQQANGCWGYLPTHSYDDTSQTQYMVLCMWSAHHAGMAVPVDAVEKVMMFFVRTQDPGGGWAYQAQDSRSNQRVAQGNVTPAMSVAGMGSLYICSDLLGFNSAAAAKPTTSTGGGLPPGVRRKETAEEKAVKVRSLRPVHTSPASITGSLTLGNNWFTKNLKFASDIPWTHYYMYGLERYKSFQEAVDGKPEAEPAWYNEGVEFLKKTQNGNGSWPTSGATGGEGVDTAFAVLFLTRSTKKAIQKTETGRLRGSKGLPDDLSQIAVDKSGKVISEKETPPVERLLGMLEDPDNPQNDFIFGMPDELELATDEKTRNTQLDRLRRLVVNGSFQARLTAVRTLARHRDLENAPPLIFALTDGDFRIRASAQDGLRFLSRRFAGTDLPENASDQQKRAAQEYWKQWYLSVRPDGVLIE